MKPTSDKQLKPWVPFEEQLQRLQARDMQVTRRDKALDYLERVGYYRLSGYWYPMRQIDRDAPKVKGVAVRRDTFLPGSCFEDVVRLYVFDKKLRLLALDALERIEMAVRVDVAHRLGKRDPCGYEKPECLHGNFAKKIIRDGSDKGKTRHQIWLEKYKNLLERAAKKPFVAHHKQKYGGRLPVWVAVEVWDFGLLSHLFAGMKYEDQQVIAAQYGAENGQTFAKWLRSLNFIRNVSAHHSRLWNVNMLEWSPAIQGWPDKLNPGRMFFYFSLMQHLLGVICPNSTWGERVKTLLREEFPVPGCGAWSLADFGVFEQWEAWPLWADR